MFGLSLYSTVTRLKRNLKESKQYSAKLQEQLTSIQTKTREELQESLAIQARIDCPIGAEFKYLGLPALVTGYQLDHSNSLVVCFSYKKETSICSSMLYVEGVKRLI